MPDPTGHVAQAAQLSATSEELVLGLKDPVAQAKHTMSLLAVAGAAV
jgi:hypothetical protein